jgi:hypothetical protein
MEQQQETSAKKNETGLKNWWLAELSVLEKEPIRPRQILSDAFACFTIALSLWSFYFLPDFSSTIIYWIIFGFSIFAAFFLCTVAITDQHCPRFYTISSWFDNKLFIPWILMFTPIMALTRLFVLFATSERDKADINVYIIFGILALFFIFYIITHFINSIRTIIKPNIPIATLYVMTISGLLFLWIIVLFNILGWIKPIENEVLSYLFVLIIAGIPLLQAFIKNPEVKKHSEVLALVSLILIGCTIIWLFIGVITSLGINWIGWYFGLITISLIILGLGMYLDVQIRSYLIMPRNKLEREVGK